ncbi:MAG: ABC transporter ATP-binding protein [Janthinobacterium sp.]|jgi:NitT/TauT family transport system ATP-binding protein
MLSLRNVAKTYHNNDRNLVAPNGVSFDIAQGELVTIFGPNGSGKTTLFNIIAGLETLSKGKITFDGKPREDAQISFVFQNYNESMFPWLTVLDNVLFPLDVKKIPRSESILKAEHILKKVRLWEHKDKHLYQLSGGMKQLAAISRAFISDPEYLLMDEPCSSLDYATTKRIELELLSLWQERKITTLVISHDIDEAIFLADKVIIMSPRPGTVKTIINVDLPRPRDLSTFKSKRFFELRAEVLSAFMYE